LTRERQGRFLPAGQLFFHLRRRDSRGDWTPLELFCREVASPSVEITELLAAA
jgi:hypothetical protein